jgi:ferredoxin
MTATGERIRANVWGRFYVTDACDACGICAEMAPWHFARSWDGTYYVVSDQPTDAAEERTLREAMAACPLHCIKDDWDAD